MSIPLSKVNNTRPKVNDRIAYTWLPHSTALGASSTVAVCVRNASLTFDSGTLCHAYFDRRYSLGAGNGGADCDDEKKRSEGEEYDSEIKLAAAEGRFEFDSQEEGEPTIISMHECHVEASLHVSGMPSQAAPVSTRHVALAPFGDPVNHRALGARLCFDPQTGACVDWATATFDTLISLPVRWRDLTRDACLAFNVYCEGDWSQGVHVDNLAGGGDTNFQLERSDDLPVGKVWGTTIPIFDQHGRMRSGLYKLKLHPNVLADGGMGYSSNEDQTTNAKTNISDIAKEKSIETFLEGGATPGILQFSELNKQPGHAFTRWRRGKIHDGEEDPKWKASLILHELFRLPLSGQSSEGMNGSGGNDSGNLSTGHQRSVPWLDALTKQHCLETLNDPDNPELHENYNDENVAYKLNPSYDASTVHHNAQQPKQQQNLPSPTSSYHHTPYLIIELPTPPIPIIFEEPLYPIETSSHSRGTTGSIVATELSKFHSKFGSEGSDIETGGQNGFGDIAVRVSPLAMESGNLSTAPAPPGSSKGKISTSLTDPSEGAPILATLPHSQAFLYPIVQTLDHEPPLTDENESPEDNPAQDKYRILAHDSIRGLVDPGLKPDRDQRGRLERIVGSPSYHLSTEEKDLLWQFRFSLVDNRRALTKFLLAVDWTVESEVVQAAELLNQWRKRSPIEVTDALKLLGRNVAFQTSLVRSYAIETLSGAPDEELRLYLLQLVQALKYEEDVSGGASSGNLAANAFVASGQSELGRVSSLAAFLIERASRNIELANFLYWYLRVEMLNPIYEARYRKVFASFEKKLMSVTVENGSITQLPTTANLGKSGTVASTPTSTIAEQDTGSTLSLWNLLTQQERFISGIMECQRNSLLVRGKKDAKESNLRDMLESGGFRCIPNAVPLPSAPHIFVKGVDPKSVRMFKSALYPAVVDFVVDHVKSNNSRRNVPTRGGSRPGSSWSKVTQNISTYKVMIKTGDDLRQDQLVIMMINLMDRLLKRGTLDLCLKPYSIMAMPHNAGLVEFVEGSIPVSQILSNNSNSIMAYFQTVAKQVGARHSVKPDVLQTYIRSCAGYCVLTYLLGVGDRHLDNIMIQPSGHFFHIDFGFIFGRDPKPLPPAFRLTKEMVDGMGGTDSVEYRQFCSLACQAFNELRKSAGLVLNLLHLMGDAGIEDLSNNPNADAIGIISKVEERFKLELTDEQAESFFLGLINESLAALAPRVMEMFHQLSVARR